VDDSGFKKRELNASVEDKTQWKLTVYSGYIPETQSGLKCGDVIWLHHSETNTTIAAARKDSVMTFEMNKWLSVETLLLKIIEGKSKESYEDYIGDTYSMWVIEYENYREGGLVEYEQNYRFKHLSSGLYLAGKGGLVNKKNSFFLSVRRTEETLFRFMPLKNQSLQDKVVKKGSYVYICNSKESWIDIIPTMDDMGV
jgi:MIR domain